MTEKSTVAIIGMGNIGGALARNLVRGNRPVILADRNLKKATALAKDLGALSVAAEIPGAIKDADIIILAIYFDAIKEFFSTYAHGLKGKIIIDPSNPIAPDEKGGFKKIIGKDQSSGQLLAGLLPAGARLAKGFGALGAASLASAAFTRPASAMFYATDELDINPEVESLIADGGYAPVRIGSLDQSIRIEVFGDLHEFGALGRVVTAEEAESKI